jgi:hypothetical protein
MPLSIIVCLPPCVPAPSTLPEAVSSTRATGPVLICSQERRSKKEPRRGLGIARALDSLSPSCADWRQRSTRDCSLLPSFVECRALAGYAVHVAPTPTRALPTALPSGGSLRW